MHEKFFWRIPEEKFERFCLDFLREISGGFFAGIGSNP